jgi:hypothetical protein
MRAGICNKRQDFLSNPDMSGASIEAPKQPPVETAFL